MSIHSFHHLVLVMGKKIPGSMCIKMKWHKLPALKKRQNRTRNFIRSFHFIFTLENILTNLHNRGVVKNVALSLTIAGFLAACGGGSTESSSANTAKLLSSNGQVIDLVYKGNPCGLCWAKTSNSKSGTNATPSSDTIYFHSEGEAHARAELRFSTFSSGQHEFNGTMQVVLNNGGRISVMQTFSDKSGKPASQIAIDNDGTFYEVQGGGSCGIKASTGSSYSMRASYNSSTGKIESWVGGHKCPTINGGSANGQLYTKIGAYRTDSGTGSMTTKWSSFTLN